MATLQVWYMLIDELVLLAADKKAFRCTLKPIDDKELDHMARAAVANTPFTNPAIRTGRTRTNLSTTTVKSALYQLPGFLTG